MAGSADSADVWPVVSVRQGCFAEEGDAVRFQTRLGAVLSEFELASFNPFQAGA